MLFERTNDRERRTDQGGSRESIPQTMLVVAGEAMA